MSPHSAGRRDRTLKIHQISGLKFTQISPAQRFVQQIEFSKLVSLLAKSQAATIDS
jgi:hypothetical protein